MTPWSWAWIIVAVVWIGLEVSAAIRGDQPGQPRTFTANVRWLITGPGIAHQTARIGAIALLSWLPFHFQLPYTDWQSVWPNIVASVLCAITALPAGIKGVRAFLAHHKATMAAHHEALKAHVDQHHERLLQRLRDELKP
jgi:hypothetical protein